MDSNQLTFQMMISSFMIFFLKNKSIKVNKYKYIVHICVILDFDKISYFFNKKSMRKVDGFPTTVGSFWVVPQIAATMHPAPETQKWKANCM